ncbi:histidine phosphatase family protein, partial [Caballeronia grimmiae]
YQGSVVVVAWEHALVEETARRIIKRSGGDASSVPKWASADFDSIYVVRITHHAGTAVASFTVDREGLNGQPAACPAR